MENILSRLTESHRITRSHIDVVLEYCKLATLSTLSEAQADRMAEILELAQSDSLLDFLINEADRFLAHALDSNQKHFVKNQQAMLEVKLREFLVSPNNQESEFSSVWNKKLSYGMQNLSKRLQQQLKESGFDPGPIDGIYGPRTQAALKKFYKAKNLEAKGVELPEALAALLR